MATQSPEYIEREEQFHLLTPNEYANLRRRTSPMALCPANETDITGYDYTLKKMHDILAKYPVKSEAYLTNEKAPDLNAYVAWKSISVPALVKHYSVEDVRSEFRDIFTWIDEYEEENGLVFASHSEVAVEPETLDDMKPAEVLPQRASYPHNWQDIMDAAKILTSMAKDNWLGDYVNVPPTQFDNRVDATSMISHPAAEPLTPQPFPHPKAMPLPDNDDDTLLLNPTAEDSLRRWLGAENIVERFEMIPRGTDCNGNPYATYKLVYMVDGEKFSHVTPRFEKNAVRCKSYRSKPRLIMKFPVTMQPAPRSRKRPLDSGISFGGSCAGLPLSKRPRANSNNDAPLSSITKSSTGQTGAFSTEDEGIRNISGSSSSSRSTINEQDVSNLRAVLTPSAMTTIITAVSPAARLSKETVPSHSPNSSDFAPTIRHNPIRARAELTAPRKIAAPRKSRLSSRVTAPAPIATPKRPRDLPQMRVLRSRPEANVLSPITPAPKVLPSTPTPKSSGKNKYVPITSNPIRWSATELYHLNKLARKGLAPQDLHPLMGTAFPNIHRSIHAVKDRRDKMQRAKELDGPMPNYDAKYGDIQLGQLMQ